MTGFTVIDKITGEYPDCEKIALNEDWAKHLIYCDIDIFAIDEDGTLILTDDCGNVAYCPNDRFEIKWDSPWHTGTPTEKGDYLGYTNADFYVILKWNGRAFDVYSDYRGDIIAWQKIEPYKEATK